VGVNAGNGLLVMVGSGETSPSMVTLHRELVAHLGGDADAVILVPLLGLRRRLRADGAYDLADAVREAVGAGGVRLYDTAKGSAWRWEEETDDQQTGSRSEAQRPPPDPFRSICALA